MPPASITIHVCLAAGDCERNADGKTVFNANVTVSGADTITISAQGVTGTPSFVDYGQTDFPQCSVVNKLGVALGPFSIPVG